MNLEHSPTKVVYIHDIENGNYARAFQEASLESPLHISSFTDSENNDYIDELPQAAKESDVIFIPKDGLRRKTDACVAALGAIFNDPSKRRRIIYYNNDTADDGYFNIFERAAMEASR